MRAYTHKKNRLRWFGHVERKDDSDWIKFCTTWEAEGIKTGRTPEKDLVGFCVKNDMESLDVSQKDVQFRIK